jgi:hypothetical protein
MHEQEEKKILNSTSFLKQYSQKKEYRQLIRTAAIIIILKIVNASLQSDEFNTK